MGFAGINLKNYLSGNGLFNENIEILVINNSEKGQNVEPSLPVLINAVINTGGFTRKDFNPTSWVDHLKREIIGGDGP